MKKTKKNADNFVGLISALDTKTKKGKTVYFCLCAAMIIISLISMVPFLWTFLSGLKTVEEFFAVPATIIPKKYVFENIAELFTVYKIYKYALNSLIVILGALAVEISTASISGYVISRIKPVGSKILFTLILWTMMMPGTVSMVPLFMTFIDFPIGHINMMDTYFPMWIIAGASCFHMLMFKDFFDGIPISFVEAAKMDGASKLQIFFKVILPLSKPILATISVFVITTNWNDFMWPYLMLKDKSRYTVSLALYLLQGNMQAPKALMFSIIVMIPMVIVYLISQKYVVSNSVSEGEKG